MTHPYDFIVEAMDLLEKPSVQTHLIPLSHVPKIFTNLSLIDRTRMMSQGYTNHPDFHHYHEFTLFYALKPNKSASQALIDAIEKYQMIIDCALAIDIYHYYCILKAMIKIYGETVAHDRFDNVFGSADEVTPASRRLKFIHPYALTLAVAKLKDGLYNDLEIIYPFSFLLFQLKKHENFTDLKRNLVLGAFIGYEGDRKNYDKRHPTGIGGGFNCIVTSVEPLQVRTYTSSKDCSVEDLYAMHIAEYQLPPTVEDLEKRHKNKNLNIDNEEDDEIPESPDSNKIIGLLNNFTIFSQNELEVLLKCPIDQVKYILDLKFNAFSNKVQFGSSEDAQNFINRRCKYFIESLSSVEANIPFSQNKSNNNLNLPNSYLPARAAGVVTGLTTRVSDGSAAVDSWFKRGCLNTKNK